MGKSKITHLGAGLVLFILCFVSNGMAAYNKYEDDSRAQRNSEKTVFSSVADSPSYLIKALKLSLKNSLLWIETYHVTDKFSYYYKKITDKGIYPGVTDIGDRHNMPSGIEFDYGIYGSASRGSNTPFAIQYRDYIAPFIEGTAETVLINAWAKADQNRYRDFGFQKTVNGIFLSDYYTKGTLRYQDAPREDYFGEGPNLSVGSGYSFSVSEISFSTAIGREFINGIKAEIGAIISSVEIDDAKDSDKRNILSLSNLKGGSGADLFGLGFSVEHDTRDSVLDAKRGGYERIKVNYYDGINGDDFQYCKLQFDIAAYLPVGEWFNFLYWDSAFAMRLGGEVNKDVNDGHIPFFDLAKLGGEETLRGYQYNRFFDENSLYYSFEYHIGFQFGISFGGERWLTNSLHHKIPV